jgi:hypothetical protein
VKACIGRGGLPRAARSDTIESLKLIEPIVAELGYTGQISFDFLVTDDGLTFVECNPGATEGLPADASGGVQSVLGSPKPSATRLSRLQQPAGVRET